MKKALVLMLVLVLPGCLTAAKQTYYGVTGPQGEWLLLKEAGPAAMMKYRALDVATFANDLPGIIPPEVVNAVTDDIVKEVTKLDAEGGRPVAASAVGSFTRGAARVPTLVLTGTLLDITGESIPGMKIISGETHLIARFQLRDKATGEVLAEGNLRGIVKFVGDVKKVSLAEGMARGTRKMLEKMCDWKVNKDRTKEEKD